MKLLKEAAKHLYIKLQKKYFSKLKLKQITEFYNPNFEILWKEYFNKNNLEEKNTQLCKNLTDTEIKLINTLVYRHRLYANSLEFENEYFINPVNIFTEEELKEQKNCKKFIKTGKKIYNFPTDFYEYSVLYYHNGLKLLNNNCIDYLENKDFIDGGACIGDSASVFEKEYNPKNIYSFEPLKSNLSAIKKTIELNSLNKVISVPLGLSDKQETTVINVNNKNIGGSSIIQSQNLNEQEEIKLTTIDKYAKDNTLDIGLIKLDVEGFEWNVLQGAIETIKEQRPILLISIYHTPKDFFEIKPFLESLNLNYQFKIVKLTPNCSISEVMLLAYPQELD